MERVSEAVSKRSELRNKRANDVCRELRYQIVKYGAIGDPDAIMRTMNKWMKVAKKDKYTRPLK